MAPFLTARDAAGIDRPEIRRGRKDIRRTRRAQPLAPSKRAACGEFPVAQETQVHDPSLAFDRVIPSDISLLDATVTDIIRTIERTTCCQDTERVGLAVREALTNAIVHGNRCDPAKMVRVSIAVNQGCYLLIVVKDSGSGFDPRGIPDPTAAQNVLANHGRGIFLMNRLMDEVAFRFEHGTEVRMRMRCQPLEAADPPKCPGGCR